MSSVDTRPVPVNILRWPRTRDLITQHKFIYMYLWPNPSQTACGCYLLPLDATAADMAMTSASLADALAEFARRQLVEIDQETGEIWLPDWFRWYQPRTPAARGAAEAAIRKIASQKLREKVKKSYESMLAGGKGKEKEKDKVVAAPRACARGIADAAATDQQQQGRRRRGDEEVIHGVEVWTPADAGDVQALVDRYGAEHVEEVACGLTPAAGHRAPYPSAVLAAFQALDVAERKRAADEIHRARLNAAPSLIDLETTERGKKWLAELQRKRDSKQQEASA